MVQILPPSIFTPWHRRSRPRRQRIFRCAPYPRLSSTLGNKTPTMNDDIVELDRLSMSNIQKKAGLEFNPVARHSRLEKEIFFGSRLIRVHRSQTLIAYLQFLVRPDRLADFQSIQIHPSYRHNLSVIRELAREAIDLVSESDAINIRSTVHLTNDASLSLHRKLGFSVAEARADQIVFETEPRTLIQRLNRLIHQTKKA